MIVMLAIIGMIASYQLGQKTKTGKISIGIEGKGKGKELSTEQDELSKRIEAVMPPGSQHWLFYKLVDGEDGICSCISCSLPTMMKVAYLATKQVKEELKEKLGE